MTVSLHLLAVEPRDVIEDLGFGLAQLRVLLLASGIWFVDGLELSLVNAVATSTAAEFGLGGYGMSFLSTATFAGLGVGCLLGGYLGDAIGRKAPILMSYAGVAFWGLATVFARTYGQLMCFRVAVGLSMGMGMPPSQAMQSELSPEKKRMVMMMGRGLIFSCGQAYATMLFVIDDPTLQHLNWRWCFALCVPFPVVMGLLAYAFLPESPLFLACTGDDAGARGVFAEMRLLNSWSWASGTKPVEDITHEKRSFNIVPTPTGSLACQLHIVFGQQTLRCTLAALLASFTTNLMTYGNAYAEPQVLIQERTAFLPAWQLLLESFYSGIGALMLVVADRLLSRRNGLAASIAAVSAMMVSFAWCVHFGTFTWRLGVVFQATMLLLRVSGKMTTLFAHQIGSEIHPTTVASMGTGIIVGVGRLGAVLAPVLFQWCYAITGTPHDFYYAVAVLGLLSAAVVLLFVPRNLQDAVDAASRAQRETLPLMRAGSQ